MSTLCDAMCQSTASSRFGRQGPKELWMEVCNIVQEAVSKTIPKKKKCMKAKWLSEMALQIAEERREAKGKREKEKYIQLKAEFQRI